MLKVRKELKQYAGDEVKCTAIFKKISKVKNGTGVKTVLLVDVSVNDNVTIDHMWIIKKSLNVDPLFFDGMNGKELSFKAVIDTYKKVYDKKIIKDYCLTNIKNICWL